MHDYVFDAELVRLALVLGVVASMLYYERFGVTTGGAIVPGYLALFMTQPSHVAATLGIAWVTYAFVQRVLRPRYMLWGRRLFEVEILLALLLQLVWSAVLLGLSPAVPQLEVIRGIGFLLPGIIAHDMGRQGSRPTTLAALASALIVFGLVTLIGALRDGLDLPQLLRGASIGVAAHRYAFPIEWISVAIVLSVLSSIALYHGGWFRRALLPDSLRTGGFVTAGYLALFALQPLDLVFATVCAVVTYWLVTGVLMRHALLFGRSKMSVMFISGMIVTWLAEILLVATGMDYTPWVGFNAIVPAVVALLANDSQRQGLVRTLVGAMFNTYLVFIGLTLMRVAAAIIERTVQSLL